MKVEDDKGRSAHQSSCQKTPKFFPGGVGFAPPDPPFKSAAVAASASQVRTLEPSRPLSRPPGVGSTWSMVWNVDYRTARSSPTRPGVSRTFFLASEKGSRMCRPGWGVRARFGPDLIFKSDQKHQKWPEMGPESTVRGDNRSRSMPGPLRSVWDGSNPLKGAVPKQKSQKVCPKTARKTALSLILAQIWPFVDALTLRVEFCSLSKLRMTWQFLFLRCA